MGSIQGGVFSFRSAQSNHRISIFSPLRGLTLSSRPLRLSLSLSSPRYPLLNPITRVITYGGGGGCGGGCGGGGGEGEEGGRNNNCFHIFCTPDSRDMLCFTDYNSYCQYTEACRREGIRLMVLLFSFIGICKVVNCWEELKMLVDPNIKGNDRLKELKGLDEMKEDAYIKGTK